MAINLHEVRVPGRGPQPARVMLIGERPGVTEAKTRKPFWGPSGEELDRYLFTLTGIQRSQCYVTNLVKTYEDYPPEPEEIERDWEVLVQEILAVEPSVIATIGLHSSRALLGPGIEMEVFHGLRFPPNWCSRCRRVHQPGAGTDWVDAIRLLDMAPWMQRTRTGIPVGQNPQRSSASVSLREHGGTDSNGQGAAPYLQEPQVCQPAPHGSTDQSRTRAETLEGGLRQRAPEGGERVPGRETPEVPVPCVRDCKYPTLPCSIMPLYHPAAGLHQPSLQAKIAHDFRQFGALIKREPLPTGHLHDPYPGYYYEEKTPGGWTEGAIDTEGSVDRPWCFSASGAPGCAIVVRADNSHWSAFDHVIYHNAIHDIPVCKSLGVSHVTMTDTMVMAALLGTEPLSLKALARRHCGMVMAEYEQVVGPAAKELALDYLSKVVDWATERETV